MHLLHTTLAKASAASAAVGGSFSAAKRQEVVVARGHHLELLRPDDTTGKVVTVCSTPTFSCIRSLVSFRLTGATTDYVVVGCDSGRLSILEYSASAGGFKAVHCETYGKTGCRRSVPGQYVAADPKGRAVMVAAVERSKLVYVLNRDASSNLTITSPLEAHKPNVITYSVVGLDNHFDNPIFACIEMDHSDADADSTGAAAAEAEKTLTYYELDLGLNHVTRKWSEPISRAANLLVAVPGGSDGPGGVLVCGENWVAYKHEGHAEVRTPLPRRLDYPTERGLLVTAVACHKQRDLFFFLLQSELGDLYKVSLEYEGDTVNDVIVSQFDTIPAASGLCITKNGLLFSAAEHGDDALWQFQGIGDGEGAATAHSVRDAELGDDAASASARAPMFTPDSPMKNLRLVDEVDSAAPVLDALAADLAGDGTAQVYAACGRGARSSLRVLRHGVAVTEMAVSELPGRPSAVWTVRNYPDNGADGLIVVSFANATLVLAIGDTVEEVKDTGLLETAPTIHVTRLADGALLQVHAGGVRHIRQGGAQKEWTTPHQKVIEKASANARQLAVSLAGGDVVYFELDATGALVELGQKELGVEIACLDVGPLPPGRARSPFMAVGCCDDSARLLSLDPGDDLLAQASRQQLAARPSSIRLAVMRAEGAAAASEADAANGDDASSAALYLHVGLATGVSQRATVDAVSGDLSDVRARFLGARPVKLFRVPIAGANAVLALSSQPWLSYAHGGRHLTTPLTYDALEYAAPFASAQCPEGVVAIAGSSLRIFTVDELGGLFNGASYPLRYTPRKMLRVPGTSTLLLVEADHNEFNAAEKAAIAAQLQAATGDGDDDGMDMDEGGADKPGEDEDDEGESKADLAARVRGPVPPNDGKWASCLRLMDAKSGKTLELLELGDNEAALSACHVAFASRPGEAFFAVGTAKTLTFHPRKLQGAYLHIYRLVENRLVLLHKTEVDAVPLALAAFAGRLLVGSGKVLRLFDLGKKKLLRKCESRPLPTLVMTVQTSGDRVYVGDMAESVHFCKYQRAENELVVFADDQIPRWVTRLCVLDYESVAVADKFGNVAVLRLPPDTSDDVEAPTAARLLWDTAALSGAATKAECSANFHVGDTVTAIWKGALSVGGAEAVCYATIGGALGAFIPAATRDDKEFFGHLEMHLREKLKLPSGRDHLSYRSYFMPVKAVCDLDLCDLFTSLPHADQRQVAADLDRTPGEILKKLEDARNRIL